MKPKRRPHGHAPNVPHEFDVLANAGMRMITHWQKTGKVVWTGPELTSSRLLATTPPIADLLSSVEAHQAGLDTIVTILLRVGMEQGFRVMQPDLDLWRGIFHDATQEKFDG